MNAIVPASTFEGYGSADFDIDTVQLNYNYTDSYGVVRTKPTDRKVVFRTDTGAQLGVHSMNYAPVPPKTMIDQARKIILQSKLDTTGIVETIRTSHSGSRTFVQYDLPAYTYLTPDNDKASLSLLAITSVDSSWPFMISVAAVQRACTNLQVFTSGEIAVFKAKHTVNLDIEHGSQLILKAVDCFDSERERWSKMYATSLDPFTAFTMFADAAGCRERVLEIANDKLIICPDLVLSHMGRANRSLSYMWDVYKNTYVHRLGQTQWAGYNAMTDWSTHTARSNKNAANVQHNRQQAVVKALSKVVEFAA